MSDAAFFSTETLLANPPTADVAPELARAFWNFMTNRYRTRVIDKRDALEMRALGEVLGRMGIVDRDAFLRRYSTTLLRRIYVPFTPGEGTNLWSQIVTCVHEHEHIEQLDREGPSYLVNYLVDANRRALYEAKAYRSNLELHWWRFGEMLPAREIAMKLRAYGCSDTDIAVAARVLLLSGDAIRRGAVCNAASKVALDWLNEHAPGLRATG